MNNANLMPLQVQLRQVRSARIRLWIVINAFVLLGCAAVYGGAAAFLDGGRSPAASEFAAAARDVSQANSEVAQLRPQLARLNAEINATRSLTEQPDLSRLMTLISRTADQQIVLSHCQIDESRPNSQPGSLRDDTADAGELLLRLDGCGKSQAAVAGFVLQLESSGVFDRVTLLQTHSQSLAGIAVTGFRIECQMQPGGGKTP